MAESDDTAMDGKTGKGTSHAISGGVTVVAARPGRDRQQQQQITKRISNHQYDSIDSGRNARHNS